MARTERDVWVGQTKSTLFEHLEALGYSETDCEHLAGVLYDLPMERPQKGDLTGDARLAMELAKLQGIDETSAKMWAQVDARLDHNKLMLLTKTAASVLGIHPITLGVNRRNESFPADLEQGGDVRAALLAYRPPRVLEVLARDRHSSGHHGRGHPRFQ